LPQQFVQAVVGLAVACAQAGINGAELEPEEEQGIAQVEALPRR